jgi:hypothetical protein
MITQFKPENQYHLWAGSCIFFAGLETGKAHGPLPAQAKGNLYPDHGAVDVENDGDFLLGERVKRKYRILFTHHLRPKIGEHALAMVLVFSIIGRTMHCQTQFHRQLAVFLMIRT